LREHWEVERELATRLRNASREERTTLYGTVYDELFRRVPDHPQLTWREQREDRRAGATAQAARLAKFLPPGGVFLEIGAGDCAVSLALAPRAARVYAVEVSREISALEHTPANFELLITDGREIPVAEGTVDLAYSNQLMEHLHPDDAAEQVAQIVAALRPGGSYMCLTPNRLLGPSDISQYFEDELASGFHLREYSDTELRDLFLGAGFATVEIVAAARGAMYRLPIAPFVAAEAGFAALPLTARLRLKRARVVRKLLSPGGGVIATRA
jgi:SAM-dependent methyltransferase